MFDRFWDWLESRKKCETCEVLKAELDRSYQYNHMLVSRLTALPEKVETPEPARLDSNTLKALKGNITPWRQRRADLERRDREEARIRKEQNFDKPVSIENLEDQIKNMETIHASER